MRIAAIYDVHGNVAAVEAVLDEVDGLRPDLIIVGGDVAAGPMPRETLDRLIALRQPAVFIRGNADREVVDAYDRLHSGQRPSIDSSSAKDRAISWTAVQISRAHRDFLASFQTRATIEVEGLGPVLFCHGSPRSDEEIITKVTPETRLAAILAETDESIVVCGHTHVQFDRVVAGKRVVNAGSVGMPYEEKTGAYWALLGPSVELRRTEYDVERAARLVRESGYLDAEDFAENNILNLPSPEEASEFFEKAEQEKERAA